MVSITYLAPAPALRPYVSSYYWFCCDEPEFTDVMRAELPQIRLVVRGQAITHYAQGRSLGGVEALLQGPTLQPSRFVTEGPLHVFGMGLLPLGWATVRAARQVLRVPRRILLPMVLSFCLVGAFAMTNSPFGIIVMLVIGLFGWLMEENGFPVAPIILGLVLGPMFERMFMTSMIKSGGDLTAFFDRPIAAVLGICVLLLWSYALVSALTRMVRRKQPA
jgi:hypothetical protein